jgi:hypothetical protein
MMVQVSIAPAKERLESGEKGVVDVLVDPTASIGATPSQVSVSSS